MSRSRQGMRLESEPSSDLGLEFEPDPRPLQAAKIAAGYRAMLDWSEELSFTATCAEMPRVTARALSANDCIRQLYAAAADEVSRMIQRGHRPPSAFSLVKPMPPVAHTGGRSSNDETLTLSDPQQLQRIANWTAAQYRLAFSRQTLGWRAMCIEVPHIFVAARRPSDCVTEARTRLSHYVASLLTENQMPPEPIQDVERRGNVSVPLLRRVA